MAVTKKIIGRIPMYIGDYDPDRVGGYGIKNRVTMYGSEFESKIEGNTYPPAEYDEIEGTVTFDEEHWAIISNGTDAWLASSKIEELGYYEENPEYIQVLLDNDGKIISGTKKDGTTVISKLSAPELDKLQMAMRQQNFYNVSRNHAASEDAIHYDASDGWGQIAHEAASLYDPNDTYHAGEVCNILGDTEHSYKSLTTQSNNYPAFERHYLKILEFLNLDAALSRISSDVYSGFAAGQVICFVNFENDVEFWRMQNDGSWEKDQTNYINNPEFVELTLDAEEKILSGITAKGEGVVCGVNVNQLRKEVDSIKESAEYFNVIVDSENRSEITTDVEGRIISYRTQEGVKVENVGINTNSLTLTNEGMTEFQQALKDSGFNPGGTGDWSDAESIEIPMPRCAVINITAPNGEAVWPSAKGVNLEYYLEFWDMSGNYFKKEIIMNAQGRSSMGWPKKNGAIDICNNNGWDDDDTFKIKFGDWVAQDSFHIKSNYTDFFRGINVVAYSLANMLWESRGRRADRPWKKALVDFTNIGNDYNSVCDDVDDMSLQMDNGARCIPDGFPCITYLNGAFWGVMSWQIKKHRDNYHMIKDEPKNIHLDGVVNYNVLFGADGDTSHVNWNPGEYQGFEIRNPKNLWTIEGEKYDGDASTSQEPVDTDTANEWISAGELPDGTPITSKISKQLKYTGKVKASILDLSTVIPELKNMRNNGATSSDIREKFEEYFDPDNIIDYLLFSIILFNYDGFSGNWQWTTWNGKKWYICPYDCDGILGQQDTGMYLITTSAQLFGNELDLPTGWIYEYYKAELLARWNEVKTLNCVEFFVNSLNDWMARIGQNNFDKEWKKWPETPSNRDSTMNAEYWQYGNVRTNAEGAAGHIYDPSTPYNIGDYVFMQAGNYYKFNCVKACTGIPPLSSTVLPFGFHDSIWRAENTINYIYNGIESLLNNLTN